MKHGNKKFFVFALLLAGFWFGLTPTPGAQTFTSLHNFDFSPEGGYPCGLTLVGNTLYGAAGTGGTNSGTGTVFSMEISGSNYSVWHTFAPTGGPILTYTNSAGAGPFSTLVLCGQTIYGTTFAGGPTGNGTIFSIGTNGSDFTNLYFFTGTNNGAKPWVCLVTSGYALYGATYSGGSSNLGTLFGINYDGGGFTNVHVFTGKPDGAVPSGLLLHGDTLYGTTLGGGTNEAGTVFAVNTNGTDFRVLHSFGYWDGVQPNGVLILSGNTLFGTTSDQGGTNEGFATNGFGFGTVGYGTVFAMNIDGTGFTNLHIFASSDGAWPDAGLVQYGNTLYGTTTQGGADGSGTIFALGTAGVNFRTVYSFTGTPYSYEGTNSDGTYPIGALILLGNTLYGTAEYGGTNASGTIFSLTLPLPPELNISCAATNVILIWPTNAITYTLQSATSLVPPVVWNPVSPSPAIVNGQNTVTNPLSATQMFYRLSQ